jgi:hypothetical protein
MTIRLGMTVRDSISGFEGIVTGRVEYITGCNQVLVCPKSKDNKPAESSGFDEDRIEILALDVHELPRKTANGACEAAPVK